MQPMLAALTLLAIPSPSPETVTLEVDGLTRKALIYAPSKPVPTGGSPLVFGFHGHGGNMRNAARSFQMHEVWPEATVVYMEGLPSAGRTDPEGVRNGWQISINDLGGRDLKFFDAMLAKVRKDHRIDAKRIYSMGHSNGGRFTYVLWATRGDVFAAYGPSGSPATGLLFRMKPAPVFHIAGEKDPLITYESQKATIDRLREMLKADPAKAKKDGYLTLEPAPNGLELATYIHPGGHEYPRVANAMMAEFFKRHPKA